MTLWRPKPRFFWNKESSFSFTVDIFLNGQKSERAGWRQNCLNMLWRHYFNSISRVKLANDNNRLKQLANRLLFNFPLHYSQSRKVWDGYIVIVKRSEGCWNNIIKRKIETQIIIQKENSTFYNQYLLACG